MLITRISLEFLSVSRNGRIDIFSLYCHRYIRLTPLLGVFVLLELSLLRFLGSGPLWLRMADQERVKCEEFWWAYLLYVHNFIPTGSMVSVTDSKLKILQLLETIFFPRHSVLSCHLVSCCRYAALFDCAGNHLFDLSIQN